MDKITKTQKREKGTKYVLNKFFYYNNKFLQSSYIAPTYYLHKKVPQSKIKNGPSIKGQKMYTNQESKKVSQSKIKTVLNQRIFAQKVPQSKNFYTFVNKSYNHSQLI